MSRARQVLKIAMISLVLNVTAPAFAEDAVPAPYEAEEFPQFLHDVRRFSIISLGAMPFVTLDASLVYSGIRYAQNDFNPAYMPSLSTLASLDSDEQIGILLTSLGISIGIGLTDLVIRLIKRGGTKKRQPVRDDGFVLIVPISQDEDALLIEVPEVEE